MTYVSTANHAKNLRASRRGEPQTTRPASKGRSAPTSKGGQLMRRVARSYMRLATNALSALCGYGLALLLGLTSLSSIDLVFDSMRAHLGPWLAIAGLLLAVLLAAIGWSASEQRKRVSRSQRLVRTTVSILRAAVGSTLVSVAVRILCGQDLLPMSGPVMHLLGWLAGHLALNGIYRFMLVHLKLISQLCARISPPCLHV